MLLALAWMSQWGEGNEKDKIMGEMKKRKLTLISDEIKTKLRQTTSKYFVTLFLVPVITGLVVAGCWHYINKIKPYKIHLYLPYANIYNYMGATTTDQGRKVLSNLPIEIKLNEDNVGTLRLGIANLNIRTLKNVEFRLYRPEGIKIVSYKGWTSWENKEYYTSGGDINNRKVASFELLRLEFSEVKPYEIIYTITGEDIEYIKRSFFIKPIK